MTPQCSFSRWENGAGSGKVTSPTSWSLGASLPLLGWGFPSPLSGSLGEDPLNPSFSEPLPCSFWSFSCLASVLSGGLKLTLENGPGRRLWKGAQSALAPPGGSRRAPSPPRADRLSTTGSGWVPVPAPLSLLLTPSPQRGAPPPQSKGLDCAISVLSGILLRTDSCFPSDSDVKLFPWPLTQLLWAASLSHHSPLPPARPLLFPSSEFFLVSSSVLLRPGGGSWAQEGVIPLGGPGGPRGSIFILGSRTL